MMLLPPLKDLLARLESGSGSRYELVNEVAHRARQIASESEITGEPMEDKPVSKAILEISKRPITTKTPASEA